jgi:hypothetical protein
MTTIPSDTLEDLEREQYIYDNIYSFTNNSGRSYSMIRQILSNLRLGMDITSITCPAFLIRPISYIEMCSEVIAPRNLIGINKLEPKDRLKAVLGSMLACCTIAPKSNYYHCKPFNPILGERFQCQWEHEDDTITKFFGEQVSHHPPITACFLKNEKAGFTIQFVTKPGTYFRGNYIEIDMPGKLILTLDKLKEDYIITVPPLFVRGILWGNGSVEHGGQFSIKCEKTKMSANVEFIESNYVKGELKYSHGQSLEFEGHIFDKVIIDNDILYDYKDIKNPKKVVKPLIEQDEMESRRVWHRAAFSLIKGEEDSTNEAKSLIENRQRELRKRGLIPDFIWFKLATEYKEDVPVYTFVGDN